MEYYGEDGYGYHPDFDFGMPDFPHEFGYGYFGRDHLLMSDDDDFTPVPAVSWSRDPEHLANQVAEKWRKMTQRARRAQKALPGFRLPIMADRLPPGCSPLPQEVWSLIFRKLAATLDPPGGIRSPGVVATDIIRAGLTCRDTYHASREGLAALAEAARPASSTSGKVLTTSRPKPAGTIDWARMDCILARPMDQPVSELKAVLYQLGLKVPPTKPGMARNLLKFYGLKHRSNVPARLCEVLRQGRCRLVRAVDPLRGRRGGEGKLPVRPEVLRALQELHAVGEVAVVRALEGRRHAGEVLRQLCYAYGDTEGLMAVHRKVTSNKEQYKKSAIAVRAAEYQSNLALAGNSCLWNAFRYCVCGHTPNTVCSLCLCATCCRSYNPVHCGLKKHNHLRRAPGASAQGPAAVTKAGPIAAGLPHAREGGAAGARAHHGRAARQGGAGPSGSGDGARDAAVAVQAAQQPGAWPAAASWQNGGLQQPAWNNPGWHAPSWQAPGYGSYGLPYHAGPSGAPGYGAQPQYGHGYGGNGWYHGPASSATSSGYDYGWQAGAAYAPAYGDATPYGHVHGGPWHGSAAAAGSGWPTPVDTRFTNPPYAQAHGGSYNGGTPGHAWQLPGASNPPHGHGGSMPPQAGPDPAHVHGGPVYGWVGGPPVPAVYGHPAAHSGMGPAYAGGSWRP